jgi:L-ascorbate metabolism protein UlaG (beta-lactamase superfamily)
MKTKVRRFVSIAFLLCLPGLWPAFPVTETRAACRNPNIAEEDIPFPRLAASAGPVEIKWYGHSFFEITSSSGTRIITDPFGNMGYPMPDVWAHVVTVGRETGNHNNVWLVKGSPLILRGLNVESNEWNQINTTFRDVLIYNVPIHTRAVPVYLRGSAFVFEVDGLCILHSGDVGEPFNQDQLELIGHVDVLLLAIGGISTMGPENGKKVIEQLKPKIVVPMHYYSNTGLLGRFTEGPFRVRNLTTNRFIVSKDTLPTITEIIIPKILLFGDL